MKEHIIKLLEDLISEMSRIDGAVIEKAYYADVVEHLKEVSMSLIVNFEKEARDEF